MFPAGVSRTDKFWCPVGRVDSSHREFFHERAAIIEYDGGTAHRSRADRAGTDQALGRGPAGVWRWSRRW